MPGAILSSDDVQARADLETQNLEGEFFVTLDASGNAIVTGTMRTPGHTVKIQAAGDVQVDSGLTILGGAFTVTAFGRLSFGPGPLASFSGGPVTRLDGNVNLTADVP